jgi:hypothetical protein
MGIHYDEEYKTKKYNFCKEVDLIDQFKFLKNYAKRNKIIVLLIHIPIIGGLTILPEDNLEDVLTKYKKKLSEKENFS